MTYLSVLVESDWPGSDPGDISNNNKADKQAITSQVGINLQHSSHMSVPTQGGPCISHMGVRLWNHWATETDKTWSKVRGAEPLKTTSPYPQGQYHALLPKGKHKKRQFPIRIAPCYSAITSYEAALVLKACSWFYKVIRSCDVNWQRNWVKIAES